MRTTKVLFNFAILNDGALEDLSLAVAAALTGNPHFPEPQPSLAALNDSINAFSNALAVAKSRDKVKVAVKNSLRTDLILMLRNLANYVTYVAKADRKLLVSSGFTISADGIASGMLSVPENLTVQPGHQSGEVIVSVNRTTNARSYLLLYKSVAAENDAWTHVASSLPYFTLTGLPALQLYHFKMGVVGTKGQTLYTDTITKPVV